MSKLVPLVVLGAVLATSADAKVIVVDPGPGTPLQDAIDAAAPGDTLRLTGSFAEAIVVDRRLRIVGANGFFAVDAGCTAPVAVTVAADRVRLDNFTVRGGTTTNVEVHGCDGVGLIRVNAQPSCAGVQYGLDAAQATRLTVRNSGFGAFNTETMNGAGCPPVLSAPGVVVYGGAAVRIADTPGDARNRVATNNVCAAAAIGILLENTADLPKPPAVTLQRNFLRSNDRGIVLRSSDGTAIRSNLVDGDSLYGDHDGFVGIELDADSDDNVLAQNEATNNVTDVSDSGTSNCWRMTSFVTGSVPASGCP